MAMGESPLPALAAGGSQADAMLAHSSIAVKLFNSQFVQRRKVLLRRRHTRLSHGLQPHCSRYMQVFRVFPLRVAVHLA